jgi:hypothetical protein
MVPTPSTDRNVEMIVYSPADGVNAAAGKGLGTSRWHPFDRDISLSDRLKGRAGSLWFLIMPKARRPDLLLQCGKKE